MESRSTLSEIPGLFSSETRQESNMSAPFEGLENTQTTNLESDRIYLLSGRSLLELLLSEKERLDPSFVYCNRLLDKEIASVQSGGTNSRLKQTEKIFIPFEDQKKYNVVGRLLGPKGFTLKRMQSETQTKMSILGRGSMKDRKKEEELRNSDIPAHTHLKEELHILIDADPPYSVQKLAAGVAEVRKMLIPLEPGQPDLIAAKYLDQGPIGLEGYSSASKLGLPRPGGPRTQFGMRGGGRSSLRGAGPRGRGRGGPPRESEGRGPERPSRGGWGSREGSDRNSRRGRGPILEGGGGFGYGAGKKNMRREEQSSHTDSRPFGGPSGGPAPDRELGGYNGRRSNFGLEASYGRMERFNEDIDPYYNSFSDPPHSPVSRDYHHGSGGGEWKATQPGRRDYRHHPYQQPSGSYY